MRKDYLAWRLAFSGALVCLLLSEVPLVLYPAIHGNFDPSYVLKDRILDALWIVFLVYAAPLIAVIIGVLYSPRLRLVAALAIASIAIGAFVSLFLMPLHQSAELRDLPKIISVLTYWAAAVLSLSSLRQSSHQPKKETGDTSK
jgi:Na+/proline symporter